MVSKEILAAVKEETSRLLFTNGFPWNELRDKVAEELAPLFADLVQQAVLRELGKQKPDHRHRRVKSVVAQVVDEWRKAQQAGQHFFYPDVAVMVELAYAAEDLPDELPPPVVFTDEDLDLDQREKTGILMAFNILTDLDQVHPPIHTQVKEAIARLTPLVKGLSHA